MIICSHQCNNRLPLKVTNITDVIVLVVDACRSVPRAGMSSSLLFLDNDKIQSSDSIRARCDKV